MTAVKPVPSEIPNGTYVEITSTMVDAAMPWLANLQYMRAGDRRQAVEDALRAALSMTPAPSHRREMK
jgi:hypothetical protein